MTFRDATSHTKIVKIGSTQWNSQIFANQWQRTPRQFEYKVSCQPLCPKDASLMWASTDGKFKELADEKKWTKTDARNGPDTSMWFSASRPVFLPRSVGLEEGRESEYADRFQHLKLIPDPDIRFNRVPEVEVYNEEKETYHAMSFHHLHELGPGLVLILTVKPRAYTVNSQGGSDSDKGGSGKGKGKGTKRLQWEFRLVNIKVMGKKDVLNSPSKNTLKRKMFLPKFDDGGSPSKQPRKE
ncbi:hypothetical protein FB45DRAFT_935900 [Roridomyces roridus]|uniref:Uncharacterized protein n=1 Tax=Roridomyces roridus TaxID=1738132 RepID=A0AAD7FEI1_9AGAR|nr:hypothetical protein FB45DRAFT_935900 [Roridomyces roridus]